jgi:prophage DNA circulation protein
MRDWKKTLRRASYRGVPFWVDWDDFSSGKRLALHEKAGGRVTDHEELGLLTPQFDVTAYLVSDLADVQALALQTACLAEGPGRLVLPMDGGMMATCATFRRSRTKDRAGYIAFDANFIPWQIDAGAVLSPADISVAVSNAFIAAASQMASFFR